MKLNNKNQLFKVTISQEGIQKRNAHVQFRSGEKVSWLAVKEEISEKLKNSVLKAKHTSGIQTTLFLLGYWWVHLTSGKSPESLLYWLYFTKESQSICNTLSLTGCQPHSSNLGQSAQFLLKPNLPWGLAARTDAKNGCCEKSLHTPSWKGSTRITESNSCIHTGPSKIQTNVWECWTPAAWGLFPFPSVPALQSVIPWEVKRKIMKCAFVSLQKLPGRGKSFGLWLITAPVQRWLQGGRAEQSQR